MCFPFLLTNEQLLGILIVSFITITFRFMYIRSNYILSEAL